MKEHVKKIQEGVEGVVEEATRGIRRRIYKGVEHAEEDARAGRRIPGAAKETIGRAKGYHDRVKQEGGYGAKARQALDHVGDKIEHTMDGIEKKVMKASDAVDRAADRMVERIDNLFYTDGEFDNDKLDAYLRTQGEALKHTGERALESVGGIVEKLKHDYHEFIPTQEEKAGKYAGMGSKHPNPRSLFKEDFDQSILFYETVRKAIPGAVPLRSEILQDIRDVVATNRPQLADHYVHQTTPTGKIRSRSQAKLEVIGKYRM
jgi:hypothetical protein